MFPHEQIFTTCDSCCYKSICNWILILLVQIFMMCCYKNNGVGERIHGVGKGIMFLITMEIKYSLQVCFYQSTTYLCLYL